jgi:mRNA-degrading endonuclease RelE of RelBE toxin-antitoxin system
VQVSVKLTSNFKKGLKPLIKKYKSILSDLENLEKELIKNPRLGTPLGKDAYKIRLKIGSKGRGKSGGARVIPFLDSSIVGVVDVVDENSLTIYLLSIYDKSEVANISDKELRDFINSLKK